MSKLIEYLRTFFELEEEVASKLMVAMTVKVYAKSDVLVKLGEVSDKMFFLEKGLVRGYYQNVQGDQFTSWLHADQAVFSSFRSFVLGEPSRVAIQFLEKSTVLSIPRATIDALCLTYPSLMRMRVTLLQNTYAASIEHNRMLQSLDATERYAQFVTLYPQLVLRVKLGYIATYLGINQATLSRIRRTCKQ